jgi:threonine/homoserine/homoserine lactone efflux protein
VLGQLLAFLGVSAVLICTPGPDTALTVRNALAGGRRVGVATAAGVATGQAVWTVATSVGVAELIRASEPAFLVMKAAGAAYLICLGLQSLWTAARPAGPGKGVWTTGSPPSGVGLPSRSGAPPPGGWGSGAPGAGPGGRDAGATRAGPGGRDAGATRAGPVGRVWLSPSRGLRQGVVSNLANPKMAAFFLSLLPQFASAAGGAGPVLALGLMFCLLTFGWLALYSAVVDRARRVLRRRRVRRALDGLSGLVLVGFGARLALQQR